MEELKQRERPTFEECSEIYGLTLGDNATADDIDNAKLLCEIVDPVIMRKVNAAVAAVCIYLICTYCMVGRMEWNGI